jgi:hypothetical protein
MYGQHTLVTGLWPTKKMTKIFLVFEPCCHSSGRKKARKPEEGDTMLIGETLPFIHDFVDELDQGLQQLKSDAGLTLGQKAWLGRCLQGIVVTNSICWVRMERASLGRYSDGMLSWHFRRPGEYWEWLLQVSVGVILKSYGMKEGMLVVDDTDRPRSKCTRQIYQVHAFKDKASGGTRKGQCLVVLVLVTPTVTLPVGVEFYMPDPAITAWAKQERALKRGGVPKDARPAKPDRDPAYPTKQALAFMVLKRFQAAFSWMRIRAVLADALYGTPTFLDATSALFGGVQVVSQLRKNQKVRFKTQEWSVETYFQKFPGTPLSIRLRGGVEQMTTVGSARLRVMAHQTKRFVMAMKYEGEDAYRYLVATDLSWRTEDIVQTHTVRWLIEVFFQDWKAYEGWGQMAKQPGEDGSRRSLILSLLCDHCLLRHPDQLARIERKQPAYTVGSLCEAVKVESLMQCLWQVVSSEHPQEQFQQVAAHAKAVFAPRESGKHMVGRDLGRVEATPSLVYRAQIALKTA